MKRFALAGLTLAFLAACADVPTAVPVTPPQDEQVNLAAKEAAKADLGEPQVALRTPWTLMHSTLGAADYSLSSIAFAPEAGPFANTRYFGDDVVQGPVNIGFGFDFFG